MRDAIYEMQRNVVYPIVKIQTMFKTKRITYREKNYCPTLSTLNCICSCSWSVYWLKENLVATERSFNWTMRKICVVVGGWWWWLVCGWEKKKGLGLVSVSTIALYTQRLPTHYFMYILVWGARTIISGC